MLPRVVVLGVPGEDDLAEAELSTGIVQPLDKNATVLPEKKEKKSTMIFFS